MKVKHATLTLLCILGFLPVTPLRAQLPKYGIYQLLPPSNDHLPLSYYTKYIYNIEDYFKVNFIPEKEVTKYNLNYALVALDTANQTLKVVFLPDSVSVEGKKKWQDAKAENDAEINFAQEYSIHLDSIGEKQNLDEWFPTDNGLNGTVIFNPTLSGLMAFAVFPPEIKTTQSYDSVRKSYRIGKNYTFGEAFFTPFFGYGQPVYKDLIFTFNHGHIPMYSTTKKNQKAIEYFDENEYIAVLKDSLNWLKVQRIKVVKNNSTNYSFEGGKLPSDRPLIYTGWVRKEDLSPFPWVKQRQQTKQFRFEVSETVNTSNYSDNGEVYGIKIINKKTGQVQLITQLGADLFDSLQDVVQLQDCNFDGYPDLMIFAHSGGAGPNDGFDFFIYNPKSGQFVYNEALSDLTQVSIDKENKTISSAFRDGCCHHGGATCRVINNQLDTVSFWDDQALNGGYFLKTTISKKVAGAWKDSISYQANILPEKASLFLAPDSTSKLITNLSKGDVVIIEDSTPLWIKVNGTRLKDNKTFDFDGWIKKTTILPESWQSVKAQTSKFRFLVSTDSNTSSPYGIKVVDKQNNHLIQIILLYEPVYANSSDSLIQTGDYNRDGLEDFRIVHYKEEDQPQAYTVYLFDQKEGIFKQSNSKEAARQYK